MKILLACMAYDYGDKARGHSYEYYNFFQSLKGQGHEVELFDYMTEFKSLGKEGMNLKLLERAAATKPALAMFSLYTDEFEPETIRALRKHMLTLCFFHDDTWRVDFSRYWALQFDYFTTPDVYGERTYRALGLQNAIHFPFGCNEVLFRKVDSVHSFDVSFVGAWHPYRQWLVERLRKAGVSVKTAGYRWPEGIVSHEEMVAIFNQSRINLNLSNSASWDARYLVTSPRGLLNRVRSPKAVEQLKARHFEINGCGAFQLSYYVEGLEMQYAIGREISVYLDPDDLLRKVQLYLAEPDLRNEIAKAGYARTIAEHTFARRFQRVFARMGLPHG